MRKGVKEGLKAMTRKCMGLKRGESCLIIADRSGGRHLIARELKKTAEECGAMCSVLLIRKPKRDGAEPERKTAYVMLSYDVVFMLTGRSLSHTKARAFASRKGARIASMPGITKEIITRAVNVDYRSMASLTKKIADRLDPAKNARVTTASGTDLSFSIKGRLAHGRKSGIYRNKGDWGNLPEGEAYIAPVEGTANGTYIVDASQAGVGKLKRPIKITVKDGMVSSIDGGKEARALKSLLLRLKDRRVFNLAEFGIGTNRKAKLTGTILEDEKAYGTCHFAIGSNSSFGGRVSVPVHLDGIIRRPTIYLDGKSIMKEGRITL